MKTNRLSLGIFCIFAFAPVWVCCAVMLLFGTPSDIWIILIYTGFMFMPALASILTRVIREEGFENMHIKPHFRGNMACYVISYLLPVVLTVAGVVVFFLIYPGLFDSSLTLYREQGVSNESMLGMVLLIAPGVIAGPLVNLIPAFGEELGWRGYLLPKLKTCMSARVATVVSGVIWGIWHAPMIALGHNYGLNYFGYPWMGILLMTVFCVFFGAFLSWLTLRTDSAIPAALAHGGINAVGGLGLLFTHPEYNPLLGPAPVGIIAGIPVIAAGVLFFIFLNKPVRS